MHGPDSWIASGLFALIIGVTLVMTVAAARRTRSSAHFYNAGGHINGVANGIAISAEFTSAASVLGVIGLFYTFGGDALIYLISTCIGFAFVLFTMAERYRALGRFTMADVLASRFEGRPLRVFAALSSLTVIALYLISQMVSGAQLVGLLFGLGYEASVFLICVLLVLFVSFGGMLATTWLQVVKATLFVGGLVCLSAAILVMMGFDFGQLLSRAAAMHAAGAGFWTPGAIVPDLGAKLSLAASLTFGVAGLPHILIRFCTVEDPKAARTSMVVATLVISLVVATYLIVSLGAIALVTGNPAYLAADGKLIGGSNMVFLHLVDRLGGPVLLGFVSAALYATILAVTAGLIVAAVSALAYDIIGQGRTPAEGGKGSLLVVRLCTVAVVAVGGLLTLAFERQNIGFTMSMAFAVAASANFPILLLTLHWKGLTRAGALWGGAAGLVSSVVLMILGPTIWRDILGAAEAIFPYREPTLVSIPLAFAVTWLVSRMGAARHAVQAPANRALG